MSDNKKGKNEPKDQRKPRQKQAMEKKNVEKATPKAPAKPEYVEPGPEFYKNLKRETDEIIKITQESNAKYSKKEIQSNWTKYDIPIPTYENIDQDESLGEDYEKIIQMPMSTGGHFQFKHEKSWNTATTPSEYDKYFDVDSENLAIALSSIPFYERNDINIDLFTEYDQNNMRNRASKYKERYESSKLCESKKTEDITSNVITKEDKQTNEVETLKVDEDNLNSHSKIFIKNVLDINIDLTDNKIDETKSNKNLDSMPNNINLDTKVNKVDEEVIKRIDTIDIKEDLLTRVNVPEEVKKESAPTKKPPKMQSPEDLEKWLDDFLDD